jgi:hypothetical protein
MATPSSPPGDPFAEAAGEAVQTAVMAVRLVMAIADAVRRTAEKRAGGEKPLPSEAMSKSVAGDVKHLLDPAIATALVDSADWPKMAQQLMALREAGVDLGEFLPRVGEIAVTVRDAVAANAARVAREGTGEWERLLRETLPAGPVREAILSSPAWPEMAAAMGQLQQRGVDVRQILAAAHSEGVGVDQALSRVMAAAAAPEPSPSKDALRSYGPLSIGLDVPKNLDLGNRERALQQLGISPAENAHAVRLVHDALGPGAGREAALLVGAKQWPLLAARITQLENAKEPVAAHLARLAADRTWQKGPAGKLTERLVEATTSALSTPLSDGTTPGRVSTAAARAPSVTAGPTPPLTKGAAAEPAPAPHRAPAEKKTAGRGR